MTCEICGFNLWHPIAHLRVSTWGLYDDARFPGRSLLVFNQHYEDIFDIPGPQRELFIDDLRDVAETIKRSLNPDRLNYASLGNTIHHVHWHVIPRRESEPNPSRPIWEHPEPARSLGDQERASLSEALRHALRSVTPSTSENDNGE